MQVLKKKEDLTYEIDCLQKYFEIGPKEASEYINILSDEELKFITDKFKTLRGR